MMRFTPERGVHSPYSAHARRCLVAAARLPRPGSSQLRVQLGQIGELRCLLGECRRSCQGHIVPLKEPHVPRDGILKALIHRVVPGVIKEGLDLNWGSSGVKLGLNGAK